MSKEPWPGSKIGSWAAESELAQPDEFAAVSATATADRKTFPSFKDSFSTKPMSKKVGLSEFNGSTGPTERANEENVSGSRGFSENWGSVKRNVSIDSDRVRILSRDGSLGGGKARSSDFGSGFSGDLGQRDRPKLVLEPRSCSSSNGGSNGGNVLAAKLREEVLVEKGLELEIEAKKVVVVVVGDGGGGSRPSSSQSSRSESVVDGGEGSRPTSSQSSRSESVVDGGEGSRPTSSQSSRSESVVDGGEGSRPTSSQSSRSESVVDGGEGSRPTSSQSSRLESVGGGVEVKTRVKVNPFGDAKPREVLLEEKGLDWRKIDLQLEQRRVDRPETEEETALKQEIENLKNDLEKELGNNASQGSGGDHSNLQNLIESKQRDLETLKRELDDKIRFGQRLVDRPRSGAGRPGSGAARPGSGAGRYMGLPERPTSRSGSFADYRGVEAMDRPRSRGTGGDIWTRPGENRRVGFRNNRDRGFGSSRDFNRSASRW